MSASRYIVNCVQKSNRVFGVWLSYILEFTFTTIAEHRKTLRHSLGAGRDNRSGFYYLRSSLRCRFTI